jgi:acyl-coenzyme A thioesterase PaaI-like protein
VTFIAAVGPGRVLAVGRVVSMGRSVAFLEGQLLDGGGKLLATSSSTVKLVRTNQ